MGAITRITSFFNKWFAEVIRQPALMVALVVGPFLVLLAFGEGVNVHGPKPRTLIVRPPESSGPMEPLPDELNNHIQVVGETTDMAYAQQRLKDGKIDAIAVLPPDPVEAVKKGQHAPIRILTNQIDPVTKSYTETYLSDQVAELNQRTIEKAIADAQSSMTDVQKFAQDARPVVRAMKENQGGIDQARANVDRLKAGLGPLSQAVEAANTAVSGIAFVVPGLAPATNNIHQLQQAVADLQTNVNKVDTALAGGVLPSDQDLAKITTDLDTLDETTAQIKAIPPDVLSAPFKLELTNVAPFVPSFTAFYSPAVLALLIQHLAVTLGALSMTRIRFIGMMDLLRVAPVRAWEVVTGNYLSYGVLCGVAASVLVALVVALLSVPVFGSYALLALALVLLISASLGIGFIVSMFSTSEQQAAQFAMLILLASIFFSGFVFALDKIAWPVRAVSYVLPSTYAIRTFQDVMLRGVLRQPGDLAVLFGMAFIFFAITVELFRREFQPA